MSPELRLQWNLYEKGSNLHRLMRPRRHVLVSSRYGFVYFQVPKVATRSLLASLTELDCEAVELNKVRFRPMMFHGLRSFAFVRDPWDRLHSCWANKVRDSNQFAQFYPELRDTDFESFVEFVSGWDLRTCDAHVRLQSRLIPRNVGFVGRFERLQEDYSEILSWLDLPSRTLPRRNVTTRPQPSDPYSADLRALVARLYEPDIDRFGY